MAYQGVADQLELTKRSRHAGWSGSERKAMPWEKSYDETKVLERAMFTFWSHGYKGTSMADLVEATGINRGSIYAAYDSKRTFFMRALNHYDRIYREQHLAALAQRHPPREAIIAAFDGACRNAGEKKAPAGCLLVNTALELSPHDAEIRKFVDTSLSAVEDFFHARIVAAKRAGTIGPSVAARETAQALLGLFLGLRVMARGRRNRSAMRAVLAQARAMLE